MVEERRNGEPTKGGRTNAQAAGRKALDFLTSSLIIVIAGIGVVGVLVLVALLQISGSADSNADAIVAVLTARTGVIGTLVVGAFLGLKLGTEDKDKVQEQADLARRDREQMLRAIAVVPPDTAEQVLAQTEAPPPAGPNIP